MFSFRFRESHRKPAHGRTRQHRTSLDQAGPTRSSEILAVIMSRRDKEKNEDASNKFYDTVDQMQEHLDDYLVHYNTKRYTQNTA